MSENHPIANQKGLIASLFPPAPLEHSTIHNKAEICPDLKKKSHNSAQNRTQNCTMYTWLKADKMLRFTSSGQNKPFLDFQSGIALQT